MSDLPNGWADAHLDDVCQIVRGITFPTNEKRFEAEEGLIACLRTANVQATVEWEDLWFVPLHYVKSYEQLVNLDDILISTANSYELVGKVSRVTHKKFDSTLGAFISLLRAHDGIHPGFLYYQMSSESVQRSIREMSSTTTNISNVSGAKLKTLQLHIPPAAEQTRIVAKLEELLSDLDAGVAELKAAQKKLGQYRQSLLKAAVEGALTAEWRIKNTPAETGAQLLQRILSDRRARWEAKQLAKFAEQGKTPPKDWQTKYPEPVQPDTTDLPNLPEGWVWASVDQLSFVVRGASPRPAGDPRYFGGDIPWITVGSLTADESMFLDSVDQFVTEAGRDASRHIEPQTLLLTNSGATLGVPKITRIAGCINDGSVALLEVDDPLKTYLYWFLRTQTMKLRATNQGAAQPNLNTDIVRRICVPICPPNEMREINGLLVRVIEEAHNQERNIVASLKQSTAQRQNILRAAFAGQLVPQDPNDEPASVLLERIRAERAAQAGVKKPRGRKAKESS